MSNEYNSNDIIVVDEDVDKIRARHDMYIGYSNTKAMEHLIKEVLQNSFDEAEAVKNDYVPKIEVTFDKNQNRITVIDNGRGIPLDKLVAVCTILQSTAKITKGKKQSYGRAAGKNGCGLKAANALSVECQVMSTRNNMTRMCNFEYGHLVSDKTVKAIQNHSGVYVSFIPDEKVLGKMDFTKDRFFKLCDIMCYITGNLVKCTYISKTNTEEIKEISHPRGILDLLNDISEDVQLIKPIQFKASNDIMDAEIVLTWTNDLSKLKMKANEQKSCIISFANFCTTVDGGTHVKGFIKGINKSLPKYVRDFCKSKIDIVPDDIQDGLVAVVSVNHMDASFIGQVKTKLANEDMDKFVASMVYENMKKWCETDSVEKDKLFKYFKEVALLRNKITEKKKIYSKNDNSNIFNIDTRKFLKPNILKNSTIYIVEGDSASGNIDQIRNGNNTGIVKLKGVLINAISNSLAKLRKNDEASLLMDLSGLYKNENARDIAQCEPKRFVIATDADPDGGKITSSVIVLYFFNMREIIDAGRLVKFIPPLYKIKVNKDKYIYLRNGKEYAEFLQKTITKKLKIHKYDNNKIVNKHQLIDLIDETNDYFENIQKLSKSFVMDYNVLDTIVSLYPYYEEKGISLFKKMFIKKYRDTEFIYNDKKDITILKSLVNRNMQYLLMNKVNMKKIAELYSKRKDISLEDFNFDDIFYEENDPKLKMSMLDVLFKIHLFEPEKKRFKGLGEMTPEEMALATQDSSNFVTITYNDVSLAMRTLRMLHGDGKDDAIQRKKFVKSINKLSVDELDT